MKKILFMGLAISAVLVFAQLYKFTPLGGLGYPAVVVPEEIAELLTEGRAEVVAGEPLRLGAFDLLFERAGELYAGEGMRRIDKAFPLLANEGSALLSVGDGIKLITEDFERLDAYSGLLISDGHSYNADMTPADPYGLILARMKGNIFANTVPVTIYEGNRATRLPVNSFIYHTPADTAYCAYEGGKFVIRRIEGLGEDSVVSFGDKSLSYHEYLKLLGLMPDVRLLPAARGPVFLLASLPAEEEREKRAKAVRLPLFVPPAYGEYAGTASGVFWPEEPEAPEEPAAPKAAEEPKPAAPAAPEKAEARFGPYVGLGKFTGDFSAPPYRLDYEASAQLRVYDPNKTLADAVRIYLTLSVGEKTYTQSRSVRNFEGSELGYVSSEISFGDLEWGAVYEIYGEYAWTDEDGVTKTERFGEQTLKTEGEEKEKETPAAPTAPGYAKPYVSVTPPVADVYGIYGSLSISDPEGRIKNGVRFEIARGGKTYRRAFFSSGGAFAAESLPPGTDYVISAFFAYTDERGAEVTENCFGPFEIATLGTDTLTPLTLNFEAGGIYPDRLELSGIYIDPDPEKGKTPRGLSALPYVGRIAMTADGRESALPAASLRRAVAGEAATHTTPGLYASDGEYDFDLTVYDSFGNALTLEPEALGTLKTCKAKPSAALKLLTNSAADIRIDIAFKDNDAAASVPRNILIEIFKETINPVTGGTSREPVLSTVRRADGSVETNSAHAVNPDASGGEVLVFTDLSPGAAYTASVTCDFDLNDGKGTVSEEIGSTAFTTASISGLGRLVLNVPKGEPVSSAFSLTLNARIDGGATRETLRLLLGEFSVTAVPKGNGDAEPVTLLFQKGEADFDDWATSGAALAVNLEGLESMTEYELVFGARVTAGGEKYSVPVTSNLTSYVFKTLKRPARVLVGGEEIIPAAGDPLPPMDRTPAADAFFVTSDSVDLFAVSAEDPDGAVVSGKISLLVTDYAGVVVFMRSIAPGEAPVDISAVNLSPGTEYKFSFIAREYNEGYDMSTLRFNETLDYFGLAARAGLSGGVMLKSLTRQNSGLYTGVFGVSMEDESGEIGEGGKYSLRLLTLGTDSVTLKEISWDDWSDTNFSFEDREETFTGLPGFFDFRLELFVKIGGFEKVLSATDFDTRGDVKPIRSMADFAMLTANNYAGMDGRYAVVNDLVWDASSSNNDHKLGGAANMTHIGSDTRYFNGVIDFQGHTMTVYRRGTENDKMLFWTMGASGEIRNIVLDVHYEYTGAVSRPVVLVYRNRGGLISNIQVNVWSGNPLWHTNMTPICEWNVGVIENFAVCFKTPLYGRANIGAVAVQNDGVIRNGYVYGEPIVVPDLPNSGSPPAASNIGGIVGINNSAGTVENVYSLIDIKIGNAVTPAPASTGTIAGVNNGVLRGAYGAGQPAYANSSSGYLYDGNIDAYRYYAAGPGVGNQGGKNQTAAYYYAGDDKTKGNYTRVYNTRVMSDTLKREEWHSAVLGSEFDAANTVPAGYYPHVNMSAAMPPQEYVPLPVSAPSGLDIVSAAVETQREDYAVVALSLSNPSYLTVREIAVSDINGAFVLGPGISEEGLAALDRLGLTAENLGDRTQIDGNGMSRAWVLLTDPAKYYSEYTITGLSTGESATSAPVPAPVSAFPVAAEFFCPITDFDGWTRLKAEAGLAAASQQNYRLKTDLDFTEAPAGFDPRVGLTVTDTTSSPHTFAGKLDGGVYDDDMKFTGEVHVLDNISLDAGANAQGGGVFAFVTGRVSNLHVRNLSINAPANRWVGFVRILSGKALMENVRIENADYTGPGKEYVPVSDAPRMGGLVAVQYYAAVRNSSVNGAKLRATAPSVVVGGLTGELNAGELRNSWAAGLDIVNGGVTNAYTGGIAGSSSGANMLNLYAEGRMEVSDRIAGGVTGSLPASTALQNTWNKVNISSATDTLGGVAGSVSTVNNLMPVNSLTLGDLSSAAARFTGGASGADIHRIVGNGALFESQVGGAELFGGYAARSQRLSGSASNESDDATLLYIGTGADQSDAFDLKNPRAYTHNIRMGNAFDYGEVGEGILPKLLSSVTGERLKGQPDISMGTSGAEILRVNPSGNNYADIYVQHDAGSSVTGIDALYWPDTEYSLTFVTNPDLVGYPPTAQGMSVTKVEMNFTGEPERRLDTYEIRGVLLDNVFTPAAGEINFPITLYHEISDALTWQSVMREHGQNSENFLITGNVDFSTLQTSDLPVISNVTVNRLKGDGTNGKISNYSKSGGADANLIYLVNAELGDLTFEDITVASSGVAATVGVAGKVNGEARDLVFRRVNVTGTNSYGRVGCIGNMKGTAKDIALEDVGVTGVTYVGGLAGNGLSSDFSRVSLSRVSVVASGSYAGGIAGDAGSALFTDCAAENVYVKGTSYVGGLAGNASTSYGGASSSVAVDTHNSVKDAVILGGSYTGGMFGQGQTHNLSSANSSSVTNAFVRGSSHTGGFMGECSGWRNAFANLTDAYVLGTNYVGGYNGNGSQYMNRFAMANSVVSTVNYAGDAANGYAAWVAAFKSRNTARGNAWLVAKADNIPNLSSDTTVYQYLGGYSGGNPSQLYNSVIAHSFIGGKADYVGGIAGSVSGQSLDRVAVIGVTVVGRNRVGGVGGAKTVGTLTYAAVNADVRGEDLVGGIVGDLGQNLTTAGGNTAYIRASYFAGNVTATAAGGRAAGIAANVSDPLAASSTGRQSYSNLVAAAINTPSGGTAAYFYNRVPADTAPLTSHVVFKGSKLNGASPAVDGSNIVGDANIYSQADLKTASKWYQSSLGTSFGTSYFNYGGLSKNDSPGAPYGYMPYVRDGGLLPYQNGRTANANGDGAYTYNAMPTVTNSTTLSQNPKGGIPIPAEDATDMPISTMSMRTISLMPQKLPKATIYAAGGASGLNAEFDAVNPETSLVIKTDSGLVLAETPIEERVYTFDWDFVTPLVMEVTDGHGAETYEANPRELRRSVMLWGDNYFYTDGLGIRDGEGRLLPGEFVNLRDGQGLTADGLLYDAVTGERLAGPSGPVTPRKTPSPLQSFTADGYDVESYMNFSVSESGGGEESITAMRLLYSKGETVGVTEGFSAAYDSVIFDTAGGESYLSVLDESGSIKDTMAALAKPSGFVNEGISHFANNLNSDLPYVLARYDDGRLDGFNYLTGEAPDFGNKGDLSLLEYAAEYFASAMSGTRNEAAEGYKDLKPLKEALTVFGPDKLIEGAAKLSANPEEGEEGGADGDGGEAADGAERGNERESASTAGTEETAASREAAPGPAEAGEGEGDGNTEVTPLGAVAANGTGVAVNAAGAGNGTATAVGSGTGDRRGEGLSEAPEEEAPYDGPGEEASISGAADEDETPVTDTAADGAEATGTGTAADEDEVIGTDTTADEAEAPAAGLSGATGAKGKTLAPPEKPERRSYTLVYDEKTGRYVFCDTRSMLAEGSVLPVLTATKEAGEAAAAMLAASSGTADAENPLRGGGAKALAVLFLASLLLLYACAVRRGRSG